MRSIAYHQHEVLYIIKPQENARLRVVRYKGGLPPLMIYTTLCAVMIYQGGGLDKKIDKRTLVDFLCKGYEKDILCVLH